MRRDHLFLAGMSFFGHHGALSEERERGQRFLVDIEFETDVALAGRQDDLALTVDYREVYAAARAVVEGPPLLLLETVAETIARRVLHIAGVQAVTVRVRKPEITLGGPLEAAGVEIHRRRDSQLRDMGPQTFSAE
jgi:dihydroneopterin aldolase